MKAENTKARAFKRSAARLMSIQALYQIGESTSEFQPVIEEFITFRIGENVDGLEYSAIDTKHFRAVVSGVCNRKEELDKYICDALADGWELSRIGILLLSILRAGSFELVERTDVPAKVAIDEYVELAHDFFTEKDVAFVNAALDHIAKSVRARELD